MTLTTDLAALDAATKAVQAAGTAVANDPKAAASTRKLGSAISTYAGTSTAVIHDLAPVTPPPPSGLGSITGRLYTAASIFNTPRQGAAKDPNSDKWMQTMITNCQGGFYWDTNKSSTPFYLTPDSTPLVKLTLNWQVPTVIQVPWTPNMLPAPDGQGGDNHLAIGQQPSGKVWAFQGFEIGANNALTAANYSVRDGINSDGTVNLAGNNIAGLPIEIGMVRGYNQLATDSILRCAVPCCAPNPPRWPCTGSDGSNPNGPPMGAILLLDPAYSPSSWQPDTFQTAMLTRLKTSGLGLADSNTTPSGHLGVVSLFAEAAIDGVQWTYPINGMPVEVLQHMYVVAA